MQPPAQRGTSMQAFKELVSTDVGLLSLGVILFIVLMAIYLFFHFRKLMNQKPGKEGWD
jgi:flagellar biogenesis protein FliO